MTEAALEAALEAEKEIRQRERWNRAIAVSILAVTASGLLAFAASQVYFESRGCGSPRTACIMNLKAIEGAKANWALDNHRSDRDVPTDAELFGITNYIREKPVCPDGGAYSLRAVDKRPRCTIPGHTF